MKKLILLIALFGIVFYIVSVADNTYANEMERVYFKIKNSSAFSLIVPYIRHEFSDQTFSIQAPQFIVERLKKNNQLEFIGYASQWKINNVFSPAVSSSRVDYGLTVAVLDTGIKDNPDIKNNIADCIDVKYSSLRKRCTDKNGHGTRVAEIIAGKAKIAVIQVCSNDGSCWSDDVARGIRYAADKGYKVINLSIDSWNMSIVEKNAVDYAKGKGVLVLTP